MEKPQDQFWKYFADNPFSQYGWNFIRGNICTLSELALES